MMGEAANIKKDRALVVVGDGDGGDGGVDDEPERRKGD